MFVIAVQNYSRKFTASTMEECQCCWHGNQLAAPYHESHDSYDPSSLVHYQGGICIYVCPLVHLLRHVNTSLSAYWSLLYVVYFKDECFGPDGVAMVMCDLCSLCQFAKCLYMFVLLLEDQR